MNDCARQGNQCYSGHWWWRAFVLCPGFLLREHFRPVGSQMLHLVYVEILHWFFNLPPQLCSRVWWHSGFHFQIHISPAFSLHYIPCYKMQVSWFPRGKKSILHSIAEIHNVSQMGKTEHSSHLFLLDLVGFWKGLHCFHVAECIGKLFSKVRSGVFF